MQKLNNLLGKHAQFAELSNQAQEKALIQSLWQNTVPEPIVSLSHAYQLDQGVLSVSADNAAVATKIKLTQASLLKALENSQKNNHAYKHCKVTAIKVKVQVKSNPKPRIKRILELSAVGAQHLSILAEKTAGSPLGEVLTRLASRKKTSK